MIIAKVNIESTAEQDILKVIPEHYSIEVMAGIGYVIKNVEGRIVGSCKVTDVTTKTLSVYAYNSGQTAKRAFMSAFESHNKCQFVETK